MWWVAQGCCLPYPLTLGGRRMGGGSLGGVGAPWGGLGGHGNRAGGSQTPASRLQKLFQSSIEVPRWQQNISKRQPRQYLLSKATQTHSIAPVNQPNSHIPCKFNSIYFILFGVRIKAGVHSKLWNLSQCSKKRSSTCQGRSCNAEAAIRGSHGSLTATQNS